MDALKIQGLTKRYPTFQLQDVSFSLPEGQVMGFIGVNGAGKTTTLKALMGYVHPDAGQVTLFGQPFAPEALELRQKIGYVSGGVDYFPRKRLHSITAATRRFYRDWDQAAYQGLLIRFHLDENKRPSQLSAGMRVKYQLALALSHHASLLILDEPTSGLDPVSRDDLLELFLNLQEQDGVSILFSTHITSDLEKCAQYITYIQNGRILASCPRSELLANYRLVSGTPEALAPEQTALLIGPKRHLDSVSGLIRSRDIPRFDPALVGPATLEDIMVYLERSAEK